MPNSNGETERAANHIIGRHLSAIQMMSLFPFICLDSQSARYFSTVFFQLLFYQH